MFKKNLESEQVAHGMTDLFSVSVPEELVKKLVSFFIAKKRKDLLMHGFEKGMIPELYIKEHFHSSLLLHIEKILFYFYAQALFAEKINSFGGYIPRVFTFEKNIDLATSKVIFWYQHGLRLSEGDTIQIDDLKKIKFPERKKYKDLDRQASLTFSQEEKNKEGIKEGIIAEGDWIGIKVYLADDEKIVDEKLFVKIWIYVTSEGIDREIRDIFLGKKKSESFFTNKFFLSELLSTDFLSHQFLVIIEEHVSAVYFDFGKFQKIYVYPGQNVLEKIIDIFSLRNDISLKKEKSQAVLRYFLEKIKISLEKDIIIEHECMIKEKIVKNADYLLYQSDNNFLSNIKKLACRQAMEKILIDYLAYKSKIKNDTDTIYGYLNILQRHRLKDFLYFDIAHLYDNTMKFVPIFHHVIIQMATREKAIEYLIYKLS